MQSKLTKQKQVLCLMFEHFPTMGIDIIIRSVGSKDIHSEIRVGGGECNALILWKFIYHFQFELVISSPCGPMLRLVFPS